MKNLLFITNSISFGGAAKMLCFVAESLAMRGFSVCIVNMRTSNNVTDYERKLHDAVKVITLDNIPDKQQNYHRIKEIVKIGKAEKSDVVIGFVHYPNMLAAIVGKLLHIPAIISERGDPTRNPDRSMKDKIKKYLINHAEGGVFQTDGAKVYYSKRMQERGVVIPNPIFITGEVPYCHQEERNRTVVSVGRLENEQKRLDILLKAFEIFSRSHPDYILRLYGRGPEEEIIKQWCVDLGIQDKVKFMGLTTQAMQDIARDGMFLITSDYEGISNSLLEAMATGLPCVSTDHTPGGARLLIQDHENGILAPIGDVDAIARGLCEFADDIELAKKCGDNARLVTERFKPEVIVDRWESYIGNIIDRSARKE